MDHGRLTLRFEDDGDGTGELSAEASVRGFSGRGAAYFAIARIQEFAAAISEFPLPERSRCQIAGGFWSKEVRGKLEHEHLGIDVYPIDRRGHIGIQVRMSSQLWQDTRHDSQRTTRLEIITSYEPFRKFSKNVLALLEKRVPEATIEGDELDH